MKTKPGVNSSGYIRDNNGRKVKKFDHIIGHLIYGNIKRTDFDFYLVDKEDVNFLNYILRKNEFEPGIIFDTDSPLGKEILDKPATTTFIVGNSKFYIDKIESLKEMIQNNEEGKTRYNEEGKTR